MSDAMISQVAVSRDLRERLLSDPHRPKFHFVVPDGYGLPGDPNGAFYAKGRFHLMYLYRLEGGSRWGHVSSTDLFHWRHHPDAIVAGTGNEDGIYSGGAYVNDEGDAVLSYWQQLILSPDETFEERVKNQGPTGICLVKSTDDNYDRWIPVTDQPVISSTSGGVTELLDNDGRAVTYGSADPSNIWKADDKYYMLTGNLPILQLHGMGSEGVPEYVGDHAYLFESTDLVRWDYQGEFYERRDEWTKPDEDNMCPSFFPLPDTRLGGTSSKYLLLFLSHVSGAQYYIGDYRDRHFFPERHGRMSWVDEEFFAPEALIDGQGRQIMWAWLKDGRPRDVRDASGWSGVFCLPREMWLTDDGLGIAAAREIETLRSCETKLENISLTHGVEHVIQDDGPSLLELDLTLDIKSLDRVSVSVKGSSDGREETIIFFDSTTQSLNVDTTRSSLDYGRRVVESAPLVMRENELLHLRIYIDDGVVEAFANNRQAIARNIYPRLDGRRIVLRATGSGATTARLQTWELTPSNTF